MRLSFQILPYLGEYENIDELNHLAHLLKELSPSERETLEAVMDSGQHCGSVQDLINLTQNLDCYDFHPGVDNEEMLGRLYVEDMESLEVPDNIKPYFDFEAYGRDISINENGHFAPGGYVTKVSDDFREVYHGPQDIPAGHRVFAYPQLSIREQVEAPKLFDRMARRFHVDYAFYKTGPDKYLLFFKAGQADAITACFERYSRRLLEQSKSSRIPIREQLKKAAEQLVKEPPKTQERTKEVVREER